MRKVQTGPTTVTVGTSLTHILDLEANSLLEDISIELINTGSVALSDLQILIRFNAGSTYREVIAVADWTAILAGGSLPSLIRRMGLVNPGTLAGSNAFAWFTLNPDAVESISIQGQVGSGQTTISVCSVGSTSAGNTPR